MGKNIQPTNEVPCSGVTSVLRYGSLERITCYYKDGSKEEIPSLEEYTKKVSIPEEIAVGEELGDVLAQSEIQEIVFEHPELQICKHGVEIIDSPGLNEAQARIEITERLLQETDAVIFLASAMQPLSQSERQRLEEISIQLSGGMNQPAQNLFIVVNYIDLLSTGEGRRLIQRRFENFLVGDEKPLINGKNRIHYLSAKLALDALGKGQDNQYLQTFRLFTQAIEHFLIVERGRIEIKQVSNQLTNLTQLALVELGQVEKDINLSESERQQILEQIGEASGRDVKIQFLAEQMADEVIDKVIQSYEKWNEDLVEKIVIASESWHSEYSHLWDQKRLVADYTKKFTLAVRSEIDQWGEVEFKAAILNPSLEVFERIIREDLAALQYNSSNLSEEINARFSNQLKLIISGIDDGISGAGGFLGGGAAGVALAAGLYAFTMVAIVPIIIAAVAAAVFGSFGLGLLDVDGIHDKIKAEVITKGFEKFDESLEAVYERLGEIIASAFNSRLEVADEAIQQIISCYENALQVNEKNSRISLDQLSDNKLWLAQKQKELQQLQQQIENVLE